MKTLQKPVSETQKDAMFYHGVIAVSGEYKLETYQDGEIGFEEKNFVGAETPKLGQEDVHDVDLEAEVIVDIYVDKFFAITLNGEPVNDGLIFNDYDEALEGFKTFLIKNK